MEDDIYLQHHGVKGMKWGVRKEREAGEKRERRAEKHEARASAHQKYIDELRATKPKRFITSQKQIDTAIAERTKLQTRELEDAQKVREGKMTHRQKRLLQGAAVVGVALATYAAYQTVQSGEFQRIQSKGKEYLSGKSAWKKNPELAKYDNIDDIRANIVNKINPGYGGVGTKMNCKRATYAYELNRRGYDVSATRTTTARGQTVLGDYNALSPGKKIVSNSPLLYAKRLATDTDLKNKAATANVLMDGAGISIPKGINAKKQRDRVGDGAHILDAISKMPNGSRGELGVEWDMGGGHSLAWEVIKGKAVVIDNQNGKIFTDPKQFVQMGVIANAAMTRLDNVPLNEDFLKRWVK